VPFAVVVAAGLKRAGDGRQPAGASGRAPDSGQAIHDATERFLSYWFETENDDAETTRRKIRDRHRIYTLAVLRSYDEGAVGACWGALADQSPLPPVEVLAALAELRRNNEFLFERGQPRMQSVVREYIRKHPCPN
jgi:hypothetical protein